MCDVFELTDLFDHSGNICVIEDTNSATKKASYNIQVYDLLVPSRDDEEENDKTPPDYIKLISKRLRRIIKLSN